ncbi:zinc chelation protein SecC [Rhodobacteraceae bacterium RKSG542]|uniref:YchJ family protein n=1 Tax=Pseudovibrio flavus TaxID=2529854 RepID=UPI0012BCD52E|nr:YchJ family metal-binding protein [Pseudovibrio flavus]MTI18325.1 zinc chelation protein SecC [Pseudovibrio flavus]
MSTNPADCPCKSGAAFSACCEPFLTGASLPATPQQLMRSRYSAYATKNIAYLKETLWPAHQKKFDTEGVILWANESQWLSLEIHSADGAEPDAVKGTVHFTAKYLASGQFGAQEELSLFKKKQGRWYYVKPLPLS